MTVSISVFPLFFSLNIIKYLRKLTKGRKVLDGGWSVGKLQTLKPEGPCWDSQSLYNKMETVELPLILAFTDTDRRFQELIEKPI